MERFREKNIEKRAKLTNSETPETVKGLFKISQQREKMINQYSATNEPAKGVSFEC